MKKKPIIFTIVGSIVAVAWLIGDGRFNSPLTKEPNIPKALVSVAELDTATLSKMTYANAPKLLDDKPYIDIGEGLELGFTKMTQQELDAAVSALDMSSDTSPEHKQPSMAKASTLITAMPYGEPELDFEPMSEEQLQRAIQQLDDSANRLNGDDQRSVP